MGKIYVPIMNSNITDANKDDYVRYLKKSSADLVFIALDRCTLFSKDRTASLSGLKENLEFFEQNGFEAAVWIQAFGFGDPFNEESKKMAEKYTYLKSVTGKERQFHDALCPLNEYFTRDYCDLIKDIIFAGAKAIMLDDDLCLSVRPGIGCFCDAHLELFYQKLGERPAFDDLKTLLFTGGKNKYRSAWLSVMHDTLVDFCSSVRKAADEINKNVRIGICAGYTSWDIEGADSMELSRILAGDTVPFLRFTGAPYWASRAVNRFGGQRLNTIIECTRAQEKWCRDSGIETFSEADSWPRPRYHIPASYIECFDIALKASSDMGVLKYLLDYYSSPGYETGYVAAHEKNKPLYTFIRKHFDGKTSIGVRLVEQMRRIENAPLGDEFTTEKNIMTRFFSPAAALLTSHGIPVTYDDSDSVAVFGDNALYLDTLPEKLIVDLPAAMILKERGFDIDIDGVKPAPIPRFEHFGDEKVNLYNLCGKYYNFTLPDDSEVLSRFETPDGEFYPACVRTACKNCSMLIYAFDAYTENQSSDVFLSYRRQSQLLDFLCNFPYIKGFPGVYQIFKKNENGAAILLLNIFEDEIPPSTIKLDKKYSSAEFCGCDGELSGDTIKLSTPILPFGAIAISLS